MQFTDFPELRSFRLTFRQILPEDQQNIFTGLSDPRVVEYYGVSFETFEQTKEQMEWYANLQSSETGIWWVISLAATGDFMGAIGFNGLIATHRKAELGFWILPEFWGNGYIQEALPIICDFAKNSLNLHRVEAFVESENQNCKRALHKAGFEHEGTMRDCELKKGEFISVSIYALLL
jgi:ribosomal-protein-alanine N-acetyltransferase